MLSVLVRMAGDAERLAELRVGASAGIPAAYSWNTLVEQHLGLYRGLTEPSSAVHSG